MVAPLRLVLAVSVLSFAAAACSDDEAPPAPEPRPATPAPTTGAPAADAPPPGNGEAPPGVKAATLTTVPCRFVAPKSVEGKTFSCADLTVPENRRNLGSTRTIKIHVAILKGKAGGVPTLELIGGPGGSSEELVGSLVAGRKSLVEAYGPLLAKGDLVLFDQRGVGRSLPRLGCKMDVNGDPIAECRRALEAEGVDLAAYDTVENADDAHDLKVALGVPQIDLHGISYGTRLGLEIMKRHPEDVRASILDGVMPPDVPIMGMFPVAMDGILTHVFDACKQDTTCNTTYPDLDGALGRLKTKLETTPFKVNDPGRGPYDYDWYAFSEELMQRFYTEGTGAQLPHLITSLLAQDQSAFQAALDAAAVEAAERYALEDAEDAKNPLATELFGLESKTDAETDEARAIAMGMYLSVTCNDYGQHETIAGARAAQSKIRAALRDETLLEQEFSDCKHWPLRASEPTAQAPATFPRPVLVIGGVLDPATPFEWAKHVARTLPTRQLVEVRTGGHGLMDACGAGLKGAFFGDPAKALDTTCATSRTLGFYYAPAPVTQELHASERLATRAPFVPSRPAATQLERVAERAALGSKPAILTDIHRRVHRR